jgi:CRISPR-associated helicase Cas3
MRTDMPSTEPSTGSREQFFKLNYTLLRDQVPMRWMGRLFLRLTDGRYPRLVDLPAGAGKTDVTVIWVLALAWYGLDTGTRKPVPRRLVWVVNRRVLVQQVFRLADTLQEKLCLDGAERGSLGDVREGLARLSGDGSEIFRTVQLRGQLIDDREWSVAPSVPQLIVGTVDQIGSRLLFQGYGLGKWSRPLQAALLGIDSWICVDEAHLVPAFVLTLRQFLRVTASTGHSGPEGLPSVFARLPFWITELSATPALPPPNADAIFRLIEDDYDDPPLQDRLLAARTRQVKIRWLAKHDKPEEAIEKAAAEFAGKVGTIAVFVREAGVANRIGKKLRKQFRGRVLTITGRLRGYERDRLESDAVFKRFQPPKEGADAGGAKETVFLVGTAAAEVGLDADASTVVCDFAPLPTLLQRLGRLDRRGYMSRRFHSGQPDAPTMTIFAKREEGGEDKEAAKREKANQDIRRRMLTLAKVLGAEKDEYSVSLLVAAHWREALAKEGKQEAEADSDRADDAEVSAGEDGKAKGVDSDDIVSAATWAVLLGDSSNKPPADSVGANPPSTWLERPESHATGGPVAVPPLTSAVVEHWSGTTKSRNAFLPVHPFLYGILPDEEGTPLMGVVFRLEMDALAAAPAAEAEEEFEDQAVKTQVEEIFRAFPPRRAEMHFVPLATAREWFSSAEAAAIPVAHFDGEEWSVTPNRNDRSFLQPGTTLILPTLAGSHASLRKLIEDTNDIASRDVLQGVATQRPSYWRRIVPVEPGNHLLESQDGASRIERVGKAEQSAASSCVSLGDAPPGPTRQPQLRRRLRIGTAMFRFDYWKPKRQVQPRQPLEKHLARAEKEAGRLAGVLASGNGVLLSLLVEAAKVHDEGKRNCKWQRAMGNPDCASPVAKPLVERPASIGGFRHEWESFLRMQTCSPGVPDSLSESDTQHWFDLWRHLVASHHGHLRPWLSDNGFAREVGRQQQSALRLESAQRFARLQRLLGPWRLAYLEALIKAADVAASPAEEEKGESDEQ